MAKLSDAIQRHIVQRLACYDPPSQVVLAVKEEFGIVVSRQQVAFYDPAHGKPAKQWRALFEETRTAFRASTTEIPVAHRSVRLRRLERMALAAEDRKNYKLAAELLEQIAKEEGGMFVNTKRADTPTDTEAAREVWVARIKAEMREMDRLTRGAPALAIVPDDVKTA